MNSLTNLINDGVTSIAPWAERNVTGIRISFEDDTHLYVGHGLENNEPLIRIFGTNGERTDHIPLKKHTLTKAKILVQELTAIIEKIEAEQSQE